MAKTPQIAYVAELIRQLASHEDAQPLDVSPYTRIFYTATEGTIILNPPETGHYSAVLARLTRQFGKDEDVSRTFIERCLQHAIFSALDLPKRQQQLSSDARTQLAIAELFQVLSQPTQDYKCYVPIEGIDPQSLPYRFGSVIFLQFKERELRQFGRLMQRTDASNAHVEAISWQVRRSNLWNSSCAKITIKAKDWEAALTVANQRIRIIIDSINFFSDLIPYNTGWLYMSEEAAVASVQSLIIGENIYAAPLSVKGPFPDLSFKLLKGVATLRSLLRKIDNLLKQQQQSEIDALFVSAIQWAGRASVERRREEAFLLFAIALESIMLPKGDRELSYRLRIRTAHLLGRTASERRGISKEIGALYGIRSNIVHNGHCQITDEERSRIRLIVKRVIFAMLGNRAVARLGTRHELDVWFEKKCLR